MAFGDYKIGDRGSGVSDLQGYLNDVGIAVDTDGVFGPATRAAVIVFQKARGIRADGIVGPQTLIELSTARAEGWTVPPTAIPSVPTAQTDKTVMPPMYIGPVAKAGVGGGSSMSSLLVIVGLAFVVWIFTSKKGS